MHAEVLVDSESQLSEANSSSNTLSSLPTNASPTARFMPFTTIDLPIYKLSHFPWVNTLCISENYTKDMIRTTSPEQSAIYLICISVSLHNTAGGRKENLLNESIIVMQRKPMVPFQLHHSFPLIDTLSLNSRGASTFNKNNGTRTMFLYAVVFNTYLLKDCMLPNY